MVVKTEDMALEQEPQDVDQTRPLVAILLRKRMDQLGWSIRDLSEKINVAHTTVGRWLTGDKKIAEKFAPRLAVALDVDIQSLIDAIQEGDEFVEEKKAQAKAALKALPELPGLNDKEVEVEGLSDDENFLRLWLKRQIRSNRTSYNGKINAARILADLIKSARQASGGPTTIPVVTAVYREMTPEKIKEAIFQRLSIGREGR